MVNPINDKIVMTSYDAMVHCRSLSGDQVINNKLYTPTMLCIEGTSPIVRGEIDG